MKRQTQLPILLSPPDITNLGLTPATLQSEDDVDLYAVLVSANQRVQVNVKGFDQAEGTLAR